MSFVFMVFHWPERERRDELVGSMGEMRAALERMPGCLGVDPPYVSDDGECLVGISRWESRDAFFATGITLGPAGQIAEGELRPRQRFLLDEATPGR